MERTLFGVVGVQFVIQHVRTLANLPEAEIVAVAGRNAGAAGGVEAVTAEFGAKSYRDGVEMLGRASLEAVVIAVSPRHRARALIARRDRIPRSGD